MGGGKKSSEVGEWRGTGGRGVGRDCQFQSVMSIQ